MVPHLRQKTKKLSLYMLVLILFTAPLHVQPACCLRVFARLLSALRSDLQQHPCSDLGPETYKGRFSYHRYSGFRQISSPAMNKQAQELPRDASTAINQQGQRPRMPRILIDFCSGKTVKPRAPRTGTPRQKMLAAYQQDGVRCLM
jgi:hypothetical protein